MNLETLSPYRLTIVAGIVVVVLSGGIVTVLGGVQAAAPYLQLVGAVTIPALLALGRSEANAQTLKVSVAEQQETTAQQHADNSAKLDQLAELLHKKGET